MSSNDNSLTLGETNNPYEEEKSVFEYLAFNYGGKEVNCMFKELSPKYGFDFPKETADICLKHLPTKTSLRALDIGCAVGRASFELASKCQEVVGIDFSHNFVKACNQLKKHGKMDYKVLVEGELRSDHTAVVSSSLDRSRCKFQQGDACNLLSQNLGKFDCILAGNLICRLPHPRKFLESLKDLTNSGGVVVITSPYTFMEDYTKKSNWLGGYTSKDGKEIRGLATMKTILEEHFELIDQIDVPFMIRETYRKHQWTVADVVVWRRK